MNHYNLHFFNTGIIVISSVIAVYNFNIAVLIVLISSFFLFNKITFFDYVAVGIILLVKSQYPVVLASSDLAGYVNVYNDISLGKSVFDNFTEGEFILPMIYWFFSNFFYSIDERTMAFFDILFFLIIFYPIVMSLKKYSFVPLVLLLFVDVNLVVHLFRQNIASLFLLNALVFFVPDNKFKFFFSSLITLILSGFIHLTSFIFYPIMLVSRYISIQKGKYLLILSAFIGLVFINKESLFELLKLTKDFPILNKASFALNLQDYEVHGVRSIALIGFFVSLFINKNILLMKVFYLFASIALLFYYIPIIGPRIGLVSSSILTGLPIGLFLLSIKNTYFIKK